MFTLHTYNSLVFRCDIILKNSHYTNTNFIDRFLFTFSFNITIVTPQHSFQLICFQFIQTRLVKLTGKNANTYPFGFETLHLSSFFSINRTSISLISFIPYCLILFNTDSLLFSTHCTTACLSISIVEKSIFEVEGR